jgi:hypothetical protein
MNSGSLPLTSNCDGPTWRTFSLKNFMLKVDPLDVFPGGRIDGRRVRKGRTEFHAQRCDLFVDFRRHIEQSWWFLVGLRWCAFMCDGVWGNRAGSASEIPTESDWIGEGPPTSAELTTTFRLDQLASSLISQQAVHYSPILRNYTIYSVGGLASRLSPITFLLLDQNSDALVVR